MSQVPVFEIQGQEVGFPVVVRDASSGAATYAVSARAARKLLPSDDFEIPEIWPGKTVLSIASIDYRDNDLGDYNEVSITFFVRPRGTGGGIPYVGTWLDFFAGRLGTYIYKLPVNQSFTCEAGSTIWGFPKTVETIHMNHATDTSTCRLEMDGQHVLTLTLPRGGSGSMPEREMVTYTLINGVPHRTTSVMGGEGFKVGGGGSVKLELGPHPLAQDLRDLGLPKRALMSMWTEHMHASFDPAEKI